MYTYDQNGNMVTRKHEGVDYSLAYGAENRLVEISGSNVSARYVYDGDGKRVLAVVNGVRTVYIGGYFEAQTTGTTMRGPTLFNQDKCHDNRCGRVYLSFIFGGDTTPTTPIGMVSGNFGADYYHTHRETPNAGITWRMYYGKHALRVQTSSSDDLFYLLTDHLGGTTRVLTESGALLSELRYSAWGEYSN